VEKIIGYSAYFYYEYFAEKKREELQNVIPSHYKKDKSLGNQQLSRSIEQ